MSGISAPLPLDPVAPPEIDDKRLWIGNVDIRLTEYDLLKIVQSFGEIKKFDFLFHKSGALKGLPRGYSFVTYETKEQAEKTLKALNGKVILGKPLAVKLANSIPAQEATTKKYDPLSGISSEEAKQAKNALHQIMDIEAKLKVMDDQRDKELEMCLSSTSSASLNPLLQNKHKTRTVPYHQQERKKFRPHKR